MKKALVAILILVSSPFAEARVVLPTSRSLFEIPESLGAIRKLQVDLFEEKGEWRARVKAKLADGKIRQGELRCKKKSSDDFVCRRDDGGGKFQLLLTNQGPRLSTSFFTAADEGEELAADIRSPDGGSVTVPGTKRPLSTRDEF